MFICSVGNHISEPKEPCTLVGTIFRRRTYASRKHTAADGTEVWDAGGSGYEIVKEEKRCLKHLPDQPTSPLDSPASSGVKFVQ